MASLNRVILMGNLTRDVELKYTASGTAVVNIGLAVNDRVKRGEEWVEEPTFVDVTVWGRMAEVASEYLSKGSPALFEGRLKLEKWEKAGEPRSKMVVVATSLKLLGSANGGGGGGSQQTEQAPADEEIPF